MRRRMWIGAVAVAAGVVAGAVALPGAASAEGDDASPAVPDGFAVQVGDCGQTTVAADRLPYYVSAGVKTAGLAVRVDGEIVAFTEPAAHDNGGPFESVDVLTVGPFEAETVLVEYRWFAGPQRDDLPAWDVGSYPQWGNVVAELEATAGRPWDAGDDADFVTWHEVEVAGCPPKATPSATASPSAAPSAVATATATASPSAYVPYPSDSPGDGGGLPNTGTPLGVLLILSAGLVGGGIAAMAAGRRRNTEHTPDGS